MIDSVKEPLQELESVLEDLMLLHLEVDSIRLRMRQQEMWQDTMDMTLKSMSESK